MKIFYIILATLSVSMASFAENTTAVQGSIEVKITNIQNGNGTIYLSLQDSAEGWLSSGDEVKSIRDAMQEIHGTAVITININDLAEGSYAISVFHDLNGNGELDTNFIGFPKEPYGFSAPMGKFGPPSFEDAAISIVGEKCAIEVTLN